MPGEAGAAGDDRTRSVVDALPDAPTIPGVVITGRLGTGGVGSVYRARQRVLEREVAVKVLHASPDDPEFVPRFLREATTLAGLSHPNIVACHHAGTTDAGECFLVMELIDGPDLQAHLQRSGPLPPTHALRVGAEIARALEHAQEAGIIHRDVKAANVLLKPLRSEASADTEFPWTAMLADLGLARASSESVSMQITQPGVVMGTPSTMAPEQIDAPDRVDHRADLYGLGCVLYHAVTGKRAFRQRGMNAIFAAKLQGDAPDPREDMPALDRKLAEFIQQLLARSPADRPQTHAEVIRACEELRARLEKGGRSVRAPGNPAMIGLALALVAIVVFSFAQLRDRANGEPPSKPTAEAAVQAERGASSLLGAAAGDRLAGWSPADPPSSFAPDPERLGLVGRAASGASATIARALPGGDWVLVGELAPLEDSSGRLADVVGVALELEDGARAWIKLTTLTPAQQIAHESLPLAGADASVESRNTSLAGIGAARPLAFRFAREGERLSLAIGESEPLEVPASAAPTRLVLQVEGGDASFRELELRGPGR